MHRSQAKASANSRALAAQVEALQVGAAAGAFACLCSVLVRPVHALTAARDVRATGSTGRHQAVRFDD